MLVRNIIVAFTDHSVAQRIRIILAGNGLCVAGVCTSGGQVLNLAGRLPDGGLILCSGRFQDMSVRFLAEQLSDDFDFLVLLQSGEMLADGEKGLFSLRLPVKKSDLLDSARLLLDGERTGSCAKDAGKDSVKNTQKERTERTAEEKALMEKAKGILMERNHLTEEQAHRFLQKRSMDSGIKLSDTAKTVIDGW